ncbi:MAG: hypothetical protein K2L51_07515 [Clostridiales bacterium]|nr:hypothetical protein [Clostridiales bacterium]
MKEKDIHRYIEAQDPEGKQMLKAKIDARISALPAPTPVSAPPKTRHVFSWITVCFCIVCLIVAMPFLFRTGEQKPPERFSADLSDFDSAVADYTLKDYAQTNDLPLLYLDWYDSEEIEITTWQKTRKDGKPFFFMQEDYLNGGIYDEVYISIIQENTTVNALELNPNYANKIIENGITVYWLPDGVSNSRAQFNYKGYTYYVTLWDSPEPNTVLHIVALLLQNA